MAALVSWLLVTVERGLPYFFLYAELTATLFGVGFPLYWTVAVSKRPVSDLGITKKYLGISLILQVVFAALQYTGTLAKTTLPPFEALLPLVALSFAIGFFEAVFWRGWVLPRLDAAFGLIPAILLGALLYALYHAGYAMPLSEISFLLLIGVLYAVAFRLTGSIFIIWPIFQPMGQLVTLTRDGLPLPFLASVGFFEAWILMAVLVWLANRAYNRMKAQAAQPKAQPVKG